MNDLMKKIIITLLFLGPFIGYSQSDLLGRNNNPITVAVPFVSFAPDSRGSALGDAGVASSPDAYSAHWNVAKLAFIENDMGFSFSYSPWLGNIVDDMSVNYLTFYKKIDQQQTIGASMRYFDLGELFLTNIQGVPLGVENPKELAIDGTYSKKLSQNLSVGVAGRFIWSNLTGQLNNAPDANAGTSIAVDMGVYYTRPFMLNGKNSEMAFGLNLSNIGQKVSYSTEDNEDFIPGNMRVGTAFTTSLDAFNSITILFDVNKLLVPTPPQLDETTGEIIAGEDPDRSLLSGTFGSFGDAPRGFKEELQEISYSFGVEYWYKDVFTVRSGYFTEHKNKGNRKYFTAGIGFQYQVFGVDFSYLIPKVQNHPLADTLRLSFIFTLDKGIVVEPTD
ncbi:MAG: type IX secretion system outer membrane channel protein PorV [Cytophagales bacterium]|nr:type IX secretion system outer membrane channel protein PorV [Cytophagales bacterium]